MIVSREERLRRRLGSQRRGLERSTRLRLALGLAVLCLLGLLVATYARTPDLSHLRVAMLSGSQRGNYHALVDALATEARRQRGRIANVPSAGSAENVARLVAARRSCEVHFALVQDGMAWPSDHAIELIGRLGRTEALVFLGKDADRIGSVASLRGARVGIGPPGSGTEYLVRRILARVPELNLRLSTHELVEQLDRLARGELDLAAMVIDEDAALLGEAVRERGLQILDLRGAEGLARRLPFARPGRIVAGQYDVVRGLPPEDKRVLRIDTLVVGNRCARESVTQALVTVLAGVFPDFVRLNREAGIGTGLPLAPAARAYFDAGGPDPVGVHAPWVVDIMPTASWVRLILSVSILFNALAFWHRFRLSRIDAARVRAESAVVDLFGPGITVGDIAEMEPDAAHRTEEARARLDETLAGLQALSERCRRQSLSPVTPMGQEMAYRYQEALIADLVHALRVFRGRLAS